MSFLSGLLARCRIIDFITRSCHAPRSFISLSISGSMFYLFTIRPGMIIKRASPLGTIRINYRLTQSSQFIPNGANVNEVLLSYTTLSNDHCEGSISPGVQLYPSFSIYDSPVMSVSPPKYGAHAYNFDVEQKSTALCGSALCYSNWGLWESCGAYRSATTCHGAGGRRTCWKWQPVDTPH